MKRIVVILALILATFEFASARPYRVDEIPNVQLSNRHRYTSNPDKILSAEAVREIDLACDSLRTKGIAQIAVVAVRDIGLLVKIVDKIGAFFTYWSKIVDKWGKFAPFITSI